MAMKRRRRNSSVSRPVRWQVEIYASGALKPLSVEKGYKTKADAEAVAERERRDISNRGWNVKVRVVPTAATSLGQNPRRRRRTWRPRSVAAVARRGWASHGVKAGYMRQIKRAHRKYRMAELRRRKAAKRRNRRR